MCRGVDPGFTEAGTVAQAGDEDPEKVEDGPSVAADLIARLGDEPDAVVDLAGCPVVAMEGMKVRRIKEKAAGGQVLLGPGVVFASVQFGEGMCLPVFAAEGGGCVGEAGGAELWLRRGAGRKAAGEVGGFVGSETEDVVRDLA